MKEVFQKSGPVAGEVVVPGDKSISHRAAIVSALARGTSLIRGYSPAADCESTLRALEKLGVEVKQCGADLRVKGAAGTSLREPGSAVDTGNSGTTMRLLAGAVASMPISVMLTGDDSLRRRPMKRLIEPLSRMGAHLTASDEDGHPPLFIRGGELQGIEYSSPVASAQVKSALMLAGLTARGPTSVNEMVRTRDHTERLLEATGIEVAIEGLKVTVQPGVPLAMEIDVPGDFSSAAFIIAAAAFVPGSEVLVRSVGLNPTRTGFLGLLRRMGAEVEVSLESSDWEPRGTVRVKNAPLQAVELSAEDVAMAIDEVTLIALLATRAQGRTVITGASELRHKESDRIAGTVAGLAALGARVEETCDGIAIEGPCELVGAEVAAGGDHRLAMMFAIAGLVAEGRTVVDGWEWTAVSFPGFEKVLERLGARTG